MTNNRRTLKVKNSSKNGKKMTEEGSKPVQADRYKTRLCDKFCANGVCPYDTRCMFAHGEEELRTAEDNIRDGLVTEEAIRLFRAKTYSTAASRPARKSQLGGADDFTETVSFPLEDPLEYEEDALGEEETAFYDFFDVDYESYGIPPPAYSEEYRHQPYVNVLLEPSLYPDDIFTDDNELLDSSVYHPTLFHDCYEWMEEYFPSQEMPSYIPNAMIAAAEYPVAGKTLANDFENQVLPVESGVKEP